MRGPINSSVDNVLTVSSVNRYIKEIISRDFVLSNIWIRGEISNFKSHSSGHMYFTLKDDSSLIKCVMFKTNNSYLRFTPENGMKVIIRGYISLFERDGQYQLYAEEMQNDGIGNLHIAFEQLKKKLYEEGLFDAAYKKKIPFLPGTIGVITSATGSVIRDIINVINRRFHNTHIRIYPVKVQGEGAAKEICKAIRIFNEQEMADVIILARGGGSLEELWPFNEEIVARSIFASKIPVISAVGHETDYTISDFVSDLRAPTPSAAAEIVMPEKIFLSNRIRELNLRLLNSCSRNISIKREKLNKLAKATVFKHPYDRIYQERMRLDILGKSLIKAINMRNERALSRLRYCMGKLDALSPLTILSRGYGVIKSKEDGTIVKSIADVNIGDSLEISIKDGKLNCTINDMEGR